LPPAWTAHDGRALVRPVVVVPTDADPPTPESMDLFFLHLRLAQQEYRKLLLGRDTFGIAGPPVTVEGAHETAYYIQQFREGKLAPTLLMEMLRRDRVSPQDCPY